MSDSSDISSSSSDEEEVLKQKSKKHKVGQIEDRATSKFYTKDSQEDLPYVADNVFKVKKIKRNKYKTKFKSKGHSSSKVNICLTVTNK